MKLSNEQYIANEIRRFHAEMVEKEKLPLNDRKLGKEILTEALNDPERFPHFIQSVSWLINGSYGQGAYLAFRRLTKRMNRRAWLFNTVAAVEYSCPLKFACEVWNSLSSDLQTVINIALDKEINRYEIEIAIDKADEIDREVTV